MCALSIVLCQEHNRQLDRFDDVRDLLVFTEHHAMNILMQNLLLVSRLWSVIDTCIKAPFFPQSGISLHFLLSSSPCVNLFAFSKISEPKSHRSLSGLISPHLLLLTFLPISSQEMTGTITHLEVIV